MSMNRRGLIASLLPSTILLGVNAAQPEAAGPRARLIKPNIGPVLAAWVAEKPDIREAHVEILWNLGTLEVYLVEVSGSSSEEVHSRSCNESSPGSFTVSDADARALVAEIAAKMGPAPEPLVRPEQWGRPDTSAYSPQGRKCYFAAQQDRDVISSAAMWTPNGSDPRWFLWAVDWSVPDFIESVCRDSHCNLYMDRWNSHATALSLIGRGVPVVAHPFGRSVRAAGINFIRNVVEADALRHAGPASEELGAALAAASVIREDDGSPSLRRVDGRVGAFLMAAAVAASQEKINEPS